MATVKRRIIYIYLPFIVCSFLFGYPQLSQAELTPEEIIKNVFDRQGLFNRSYIIDINAISINNKEINHAGVRVYMYSKEKQIVVFTAPEKLRDSSYLVIGYNTWMFEKRLKRPLRISAQQKLFGDAGIAETAGIDYVEDYKILKMNENEATWEIDLKALDPKEAYQQAKIWINRNDLKLKQIVLIALNGRPLKQLEYSDFRLMNGHEMAKIEIRNLLYEKGHKTILEFVDIRDSEIFAEAFDPLMMSKFSALLKF
jgi:hypothetical protein